jgi:hypothetical protein
MLRESWDIRNGGDDVLNANDVLGTYNLREAENKQGKGESDLHFEYCWCERESFGGGKGLWELVEGLRSRRIRKGFIRLPHADLGGGVKLAAGKGLS